MIMKWRVDSYMKPLHIDYVTPFFRNKVRLTGGQQKSRTKLQLFCFFVTIIIIIGCCTDGNYMASEFATIDIKA